MKKLSDMYRLDNHSLGLAHVHLVWIPKRRRRVLVGDVRLRLIEILNGVAIDNNWVIQALEVAPDHVHLLVEYDSQHSIAQIVRAFKGRSARYLRQEFPHLKKTPSMWPRSYFYDTTGKISTAKVQAYINDPHHG